MALKPEDAVRNLRLILSKGWNPHTDKFTVEVAAGMIEAQAKAIAERDELLKKCSRWLKVASSGVDIVSPNPYSMLIEKIEKLLGGQGD